MTARQFNEWYEYAKWEPFGQPEQDVQMAFVRQTTAQMSMAKKKGKKPWTIDDFSLNKRRYESRFNSKQPKQKQSVEEQKQLLLGMAKYQNKTFDKQKPVSKKGKK